MNDSEFNDLLDDMKSIGHLNPLTRFGPDLNDIEELPTKGFKKGARVFFDPQTKVKYVSNSTGYVRRYIPIVYGGENITSKYFINQRKEQEEKLIDGRMWYSGVCVLLMEEEARIELIVRGIRNYRKTMKK